MSMIDALRLVFQFDVVLVVILSAAYGLAVGSIPGLTATMAAALLVPVTFYMDPVPALAAIVTMSAMAVFAGDIPAALVRIPGTPASAAYVDESYKLTKKGLTGLVLGVDATVAAIGGVMGALVLIFAARPLANVAINFTSFEYFWLACLGLSCSVLISRGSALKGFVSLLFGLLMTTVGIDVTLGFPRFTFGSTDLLGGISYIPAMIGMFGMAEVLRNVGGSELSFKSIPRIRARELFKGVAGVIRRYKVNVLRSGLIGVLVGILPGAGGDIASWITYALSKRLSKDSEKYGTGHIEGIVDAGTANNAALGGTWVPALVFGIPGDSITAIVVGVLYMKGLRPGPLIFERTPEIVYAVYITFILANLILIPFAFGAIKLSSNLLRVPRRILMPLILLFCIVGSFAINNSPFDVVLMLIFGVVAFLMEENDFPVAPAILGLVLGGLLEQSFMISMIKSDWNVLSFFSRPLAAVLGATTVGLWVSPFIVRLVGKLLQSSRLAEKRE